MSVSYLFHDKELRRAFGEFMEQEKLLKELDKCDAEIERLRAEIDSLRAARVAYASEFPPNKDGEPDVGSVHENIRKLKAEIERLRARVSELESYLQQCLLA